ncbi:hypothetical protein HID58_045737 [Brassica napus]|uniref:Uncharacterized protein n=1 Tax=Brassica napus TaxID=3708 RepID=A0ABQ8AUE7_BRANA|nr:hypothetical protein HID58_045737 [Brassica napus]
MLLQPVRGSLSDASGFSVSVFWMFLVVSLRWRHTCFSSLVFGCSFI